MRRTTWLALLLTLALPSLLAADGSAPPPRTWLPFVSGSAPAGATAVPLAGGPGAFHARVAVPGLFHGEVATEAGARAMIEIPGGAIASDLGKPRVPVLRYLVEMPPGASVTVRADASSVTTIALASLGLPSRLLPVEPPVPKIEGAEKLVPYVEDRSVYGRAGLWPEERAAVVGQAVLRGRTVAVVEVRPVRYDPVAGAIEVASDLRLDVAFEGGSPVAAAREKGRLRSAALDPTIDGEILNAAPDPAASDAPLGGAGGSANGAEGLLVIVYDGFEPAVTPLVEWKRKSGYRVEVVRTSSLGSPATDAAVKSAIQTRFDAWSNPSLGFVLLVGDTDFCPIHTGNGGGSSQVTDNWYACTSGTDYLPDLAIARISTRTSQETQDVVDKLMTYEKATFATEAWVKKAGFIGTADGSHYGMIEATHDWCIDNYITPAGYGQTSWSHGKPSSDRHYYTYDADTSEISASISEGRSIVNYSGHGATDSWAGPTSHGGYTQTNVRNNTNDQMYPFVISNACVTGSLALPECFGETWQRVPHKGAIAFWGASNNSYWDEDDYLQRSLYGNMYPMDSTPAIGPLVHQTKIDLYQHFGPTSNMAYYFDIYNLLSEPTLSVWTRAPRTLVVSYPSSLAIGQNTFEVTVTYSGSAVEGALVAARRAADGVFESGYTDATGRVSFTLDPAPVSVGPLEVTVTKHDFRPFEGTADVISPNSPWLAHRSHQIDDTLGGDGDGKANPGETIVVPVTVENVGQMPGSGLAGTLSTSTPSWVSILDASATFPNLAVSQQGTSLPDHYRIRVGDAASDGMLLGFDLHWTASDGSSGTTSLSEPVEAVDFAYDRQAIDDSAGGNGNGAAGPGETVDLTVGIANVGHKAASTIHGVLSTLSPYVTIVQGEADFPDLGPGEKGDSLPPAFRFSVAENAPDKQPVTFGLALTEQGGGHAEVLTFDVLVSSCSVTASNDVPKPIQDNATVESTLTLPSDLSISEMNVYVDIQHTYVGDLDVTLVSPIGTTVLLHNHSGGSSQNIQTWYDTDTQPAEALSKLNGEDSAGTWILRVRDTAGGDTGTLLGWKLEACGQAATPRPILSVSSHSTDDSGACNADGFADVGETVTYHVTVRNGGTASATGVSATLGSGAEVEVVNNPVPLPDLSPGASATADFVVRIGAVSCVESAAYTLSVAASEGTWGGGFADHLEADTASSSSTESLEHGGAAPAGWTHSALEGTDDWQVATTRNHTTGGAYSWFASSPNKAKDDVLISPPYGLLSGGAATLSFWQFADLQDGYDGAVLEISTDDGATWADLGTHMTAGLYDKALSGLGPLGGRQAWTGTYSAWKNTTVDLSSYAGQTVRLRFRLGCDASLKRIGWWVDDVVVATSGRVCDAHPCGVPAETRDVRVNKGGGAAVVGWRADVLAVSYRVYRSSDPSIAGSFADVTSQDPIATDTSFTDASASNAYYLISTVGPDGEGPR